MSAAVAAIFVFSGCSDSHIRVYTVPKEPRHTASVDSHTGHTHAQRPALPHLHWQLPTGWEEQKPERMRAASFRVTGPEGRMAEVAIIPLPGVSNIELEGVNLWRQELGLDPIPDRPSLEAESREVQVSDKSARMYEMVSLTNRVGNDFKTRTIGVILQRPEALWFVKLTGEDKLVADQKEKFTTFLKSLEFHESAHGEVASTETPISTNVKTLPPGTDLPNWAVPANWQERPPGAMLLANFVVSSEGGQADITISKLPGDGGGLLPNINRWRNQLSLPAITPADVSKFVSYIDIDKEKMPLVDLKGTSARSGKEARMLAVAVTRGNETWFYKLMGDEAVVLREKEPFIKFIQSAY